jgi:hypothetical protein
MPFDWEFDFCDFLIFLEIDFHASGLRLFRRVWRRWFGAELFRLHWAFVFFLPIGKDRLMASFALPC